MSYINQLDKIIKTYECFMEDFPEQKLYFRLFISELKLLRNEYFKEKEE